VRERAPMTGTETYHGGINAHPVKSGGNSTHPPESGRNAVNFPECGKKG